MVKLRLSSNFLPITLETRFQSSQIFEKYFDFDTNKRHQYGLNNWLTINDIKDCPRN